MCTKNGKLLPFQNSRLMLKVLVFNHLIIRFPIHLTYVPYPLSWLRNWVSRTSECNHCKICCCIPPAKPYKHCELHEVLAMDKNGAIQNKGM